MSHHSISVTKRCRYKDRKGQCEQMTTITHPFCARHTRQILGVSVKKSQIPGAGLGLYAEREFLKGEKIVEYTGELLSHDEFDERYGHESLGAYGITLNDSWVIDAAKTSAGVARYACDYHGSGRRPNAEYESNDHEIWIVAKRTIQPGEEIFTDYGAEMHKALGLD